MSQADIDNIIKKYDRSIPKPRIDLLYTQRKKQSRDPHMITFMDNNYTPNKQVRQSKPTSLNLTRQEELLRQLDESQKKFVVSERNYAEISRKFDKLKQAYQMISSQLEKQRKVRLQQLIDTQNKLDLLQTDNNKNLTKLQSKDHTIAILKEKLAQKEEEVGIFEIELEQISRRLCETLELKNRESQEYMSKGIQTNSEEASRSLENIRTKYEKIITNLNSQISNFNKDLLEKEKQKKKILNEMEDLSKKHITELKELKEVLAKNEEQYKLWLDESKKQKLDIVEKYEQQIREIRKGEFMQKLGKSDGLIDETSRSKAIIREIQVKNLGLQSQIKKLTIETERLNGRDKQWQIKYSNLHQQLKHIKVEYTHQMTQNKQMLSTLKEQEEKYEVIQTKINKKEVELQQLRIKNSDLESSNKLLKKQIQNLKADMGKQLKSLIYIKKQLSEATDNELNMNSMLTQASTKLQQKVKDLQSELQSITTELYAERLEKAKLNEELEETKIELKREYELSIENTRRQLQQQIKQSLQAKTQQEMEKQKMYLKMFQLERQYQLLKSEVVTSDQMLRMGTKMGKFYQRKVK